MQEVTRDKFLSTIPSHWMLDHFFSWFKGFSSLIFKRESRVRIKSWWIAGLLGWCSDTGWCNFIRRKFELGVLGGESVWQGFALLFLTLNLLLLFQNFLLLLQERHVNENAVDEDLSFTIWNRERKKSFFCLCSKVKKVESSCRTFLFSKFLIFLSSIGCFCAKCIVQCLNWIESN